MDKLQHLLNMVNIKTQAFDIAQSLYSQQLAPRFNIFNYIPSNELGLSLILADLLNPNGSHGQKHHFLRLFIHHFLPSDIKHPNWKVFLQNLDKVEVTLEEVTVKIGSSRRMDIYISYVANDASYGICIENKPYASDQHNQLKDYAKELKERHDDNWHIVYLSENRNLPSKNSVDENTLSKWQDKVHFSGLTYISLIHWLEQCQLFSQNYSVTEFLKQFVKFIQQQFMGIANMSETNEIVDVMKQNDATIKASFKVSKALNLMKQQFIEKLKSDLIEGFKIYNKYGSSLDLDLSNIGQGNSYEQINFIIQGYDKAYISFEFQNSNYNKPYIGIKFISEAAAEACSYSNQMREALSSNLPNKKISVSSLWPAGYWFHIQDWKNSHEPWLLIKNNQMANLILSEMCEVYEAFKKSV